LNHLKPPDTQTASATSLATASATEIGSLESHEPKRS
jgi:hypothetical protein